jgi:hypothetical protein
MAIFLTKSNYIDINLAQLITGLDLSDDRPYLKMGLELVLREKKLCHHKGR